MSTSAQPTQHQNPDKPKLLKQRIVVSRRWSHPQISCKITDDEINMSVDINEFLNALIAAIGTPPLQLTAAKRKAWIARRIDDATGEVIDEIKRASVYVV
jgi:hypothetical protein